MQGKTLKSIILYRMYDYGCNKSLIIDKIWPNSPLIKKFNFALVYIPDRDNL